MLSPLTMARTALAFALVAASASFASAGTYVGLGIGTPVATSGDVALEEGGRSGRLQLGWSFGRFAVEGLVGRAELSGWGYQEPVTFTSLGVAGKYNIPLQDRFEVFGRLGVQHMRLDVSNDPIYGDDTYGGNGLLIGAGVEYKINLGVAGGSVFLDYSIGRANLTNETDPNDHDLTTRVWTLGATLSF